MKIPSILMDSLVDAVASFYGVPLKDLLGRSKAAGTPRLLLYYTAAHHYGMSPAAIANLMGRDHTTITRGILSASETIPDVVELSHEIKGLADRARRGATLS